MTAPVTRRRALAASAAAALGLGVGVAPAPAVAPSHIPVSAEAAALQAELVRLSCEYRTACREADATLDDTADVAPPDALFWQPGDTGLFCRCPVDSWRSPGRLWWAEGDLIGKLRADHHRYLDGSPSRGATRRDEVVAAWDAWKAAERAAEDASGHTAAQARYEAAVASYGAFRRRLVEMRTADPEVLTVKALALADLTRDRARGLDRDIERALEREVGAYEGSLALSLARDFLALLGAGQVMA